MSWGRTCLFSAVVGLVALCWTAPSAATGFRDHATVLRVEPIVEGEYHTQAQRVCERQTPATLAIAGSIGEDVRRQAAQWARSVECRTLPQRRYRERVTGYRVTYRYGGVTMTRRMDRDPGKQLPVQVRLSPRP